MSKKIWLAAVMILVLIVGVACSADEQSGVTEKEDKSIKVSKDEKTVITTEGDLNSEKGNVLRVAINAQPPTLDPNITTANPTRDVVLQIYEPLMTLNSKLQPQPMLAESYEINDEGTVITFHLRKGVLFHNGDEMTAEDVVASMKKWQQNSSRAKASFGDAEFLVEDEYTVLMDLKKPNRSALYVLAIPTQLPAIMPKSIAESAEESGVTEYIGTGPFKFEEWQQDQYIKLSRFEDYQPSSEETDGLAGKKEALVDEIYLTIVPDSSTRVAGVISGEYDIAEQIHYDNYEQINASPGLSAYTGPAGYNVLVFNNKEGVLTDIRLRQAVAATLDMESILKASHSREEFYKPNHSIFLEEQTDWYNEAGSELYYEVNHDKAKRLMEEAGYNGEPIRLLTSRDYEDYYNASVVIKEQLENVGFTVELAVHDWATVTDLRSDPSAFEMYITAFSVQTEPTQLLYYHSENEYSGWPNSPEIDRLVEEIRAAKSQEEASKLHEELQLEVWQYLPAIKFGDKNFLYAVSDKVEGFRDLNGLGRILWNVTISE